MSNVLDRSLFFVKEHVGMLKAANNFDILDPESGEEIIHCREDNLGILTKLLRFTNYKRYTPFEIELRTPDGEKLITVKRGISIFLSKLQVLDENDQLIGGFKQKFFTIGGSFRVLDASDNEVCQLKGKRIGWTFRFLDGENELANVTKKWSGLGKELFTTADNYVLTINDSVPPGSPGRKLILAAVMCIDLVLKE
ncbi:MAG: phospholipid scramblase-related protein [Candidatus Hydrogenedentota bacterium]